MATPSQLPNPYTPMAFLPPDLANQVTVSAYIVVGSCAVLVWDILANLNGDYKLLFKYRIGVPTVVYFLSRLANLGYVLGSAILQTAATGNCANFEKALAWMFTVALASNTILFFFRVRAIYDRNLYVSLFFGFLWLCVIAGALTTTQGITVTELGPTTYCIGAGLESYVGAAIIIPLVNDTLVFLAISWRLMRNSHIESSVKNGFRAMIFGTFMPTFSKALLQDGQAYYLATVTSSLVVLILLYVPSLPPVYKTTFTSTNIAVMNIMACRVYRKTRFGIYRETTTLIDTTRHSGSDRTDASVNGPLIPVSIGGRLRGTGTGAGTGTGTGGVSGIGSGKEKRKSDTDTFTSVVSEGVRGDQPDADEVVLERRSIRDFISPESDIGNVSVERAPRKTGMAGSDDFV